MKQYGISKFKEIHTSLDIHLENIERRGYSIISKHLSPKECKEYSARLEAIYNTQKESFGEENLQKINETDVARMCFAYDETFLNLITDKTILNIIENLLGKNFILQLQNGIINRPAKEHHQKSWHRDIPYQEYTTSAPVAINVFYCFTEFNTQTGGTVLLPYSHLFPTAPSVHFFEENCIQPELHPGDVLMFNSWVYHKAGNNTSDIVRYGLNNLFTVPIIKQQIDIPKMLKGKYSDDPLLFKILGYQFETPLDVDDYRKKRLKL